MPEQTPVDAIELGNLEKWFAFVGEANSVAPCFVEEFDQQELSGIRVSSFERKGDDFKLAIQGETLEGANMWLVRENDRVSIEFEYSGGSKAVVTGSALEGMRILNGPNYTGVHVSVLTEGEVRLFQLAGNLFDHVMTVRRDIIRQQASGDMPIPQ